MTTERHRVISITLTESEWRAFIRQQPEPVQWLRERILEEAGPVVEPPKTEPAAAYH